MKTGPVVHGVLLAAALGVAWMTWTRDKTVAPATATLTIWPESGAVESLALHGTLRDLSVEKKADGDYYWASLTKTTAPPAKPAAPDGGVTMSVIEDKGTTTKQEFPVGDEGEKALGRFAPLKALRDLGAKTSKEEYGFGDESDKLTVKIGGKSHELTLGARVFGGDNRYVLDPAGGHVFVIAGEVLRPFDAPEFSLRERKLHGFQPGDVGEAVVRAGDKEKKLLHVPKAPPAEGATPPARPRRAARCPGPTPRRPTSPTRRSPTSWTASRGWRRWSTARRPRGSRRSVPSSTTARTARSSAASSCRRSRPRPPGSSSTT